MEALLAKIPDIIQIIALAGMIISIAATIAVRLTPSKTDDEKLSKVVSVFLKALQFLPTIGINPQTKKLEEAYKELKGKDEPAKTA